MSSRDDAASFGLPEGEKGDILAMINFGEFMEVYTAQSTFKMMSPDSIDPERKYETVPWVYTKVSDYGASNLLIANSVVLANDFLTQLFSNEDSKRIEIINKVKDIKDVFVEYLSSLDSFVEEFNREVEKFRMNEHVMNGKAHAYFPQLKGLDGYATDFLILAKRSIQEVSVLVNLFLPLKSKHGRIDKLLQEIEENHQSAETLIRVLKEHLRMCEYIYKLRNAQEHAATTKYPLIVNNFSIENGNQLNVPKWGIKGDELKCIHEEAKDMLSFLLMFFEEVFISSVMQIFPSFPKYEIVYNEPLNETKPVHYSLYLSLPKVF